MAREPDLEVVKRALEVHVRKLTEELKELSRENRRLRAELAEAQRAANFGKGERMRVVEIAELEDGGARITVEVEAEKLIPLAAIGIRHALVAAVLQEIGEVAEVAEDTPLPRGDRVTDDITIPPEALEAAAKARYEKWTEQTRADEQFDEYPIELLCPPWSDINEDNRAELMEQERAACLAMLRAWPGMGIEVARDESEAIILPLTQEGGE